MFKMGLISSAIGVTAIVVGLHWGTLGVSIGILTTAWLYQPFALHVACGLIGLKGHRVLLDILPTVVISLVMGALVWAAPRALGLDRQDVVVLVGQVVAGVVLYAVMMRLFRGDVVREVARLRPGRRGAVAS